MRRKLKDASTVGEDDGSSLKITDRDVRHVRGSGVLGEGEEADEGTGSEGGVPEGYEQGGGVVLNSIRVSPAGEGRWTVEGEVVNRTPAMVNNVRVQLQAAAAVPGGQPWQGEVMVSSALGPDESGVFTHSFAAEVAEGKAQPDVRASVIWMRRETRREPDFRPTQNWGGGAGHPGNLPVQTGGVTGADVRPQPTPIE
jgi:hypothetical protein